MDPLPVGTVTLLFSDIEGSTLLLARLGDRYGEALSGQREVLRTAFASRRGRELGTEGDSFFVVFASAHDAVAACIEAQRGLAARDWPGGAAVRVRMGLHTGEPARHEDGYVGMDVHRAARIAATAHGGQIVLSEPTRQLVSGRLPEGVGVLDLGWHRLKDIEAAEHLFQLTGPDLPEAFPSLKSLGAHTSLPEPATHLVGRDRELAEVRQSVLEPGVRLVTLTGPGGVGKTRLALALAATLHDTFPAGVFFVPLASAAHADGMWKGIADSIGAGAHQLPADAVATRLAGRRVLLVLDNLEQVTAAAAVIAGLLGAVPLAVVLATSRRPMHLQGECEYPVPPLPAPHGTDWEAIGESEAVQLFVQQAALVRRGFSLTAANAGDIAAIVHRLDGLPLAVELAASRVKLLPPKALLARLADSLALTATDVDRPTRQQTLKATIGWSHDLLTPRLAGVFRRMGVFAGGCDLDALAAVAAVPTESEEPAGDCDPLQAVTDLLDLSMITVAETAGGDARVGMLTTIRDFALDQLARSGDLGATRARHAAYYADFAEQAAPHLRKSHHLLWLDRLKTEHDNLRAALAWALDDTDMAATETAHRSALGMRLVSALSWFWYGHGDPREGRHWLERAIERAADGDGPDVAGAVHGLGVLLIQQGEHERARATLETNLLSWRRLGDRNGVAKGLSSLGVAHRMLGDRERAREALEESMALARDLDDSARLTTVLGNLGVVEVDRGNPDRAITLLREAIRLDETSGDGWAVVVNKANLAAAMTRAGRPAEARELLCATIDEIGGYSDIELTADTLERFAAALAVLGADARAARLIGAAARLRDEAGFPLPAPDAAILDSAASPARARTGEQAWVAQVAAGRRLTADEAVALAKLPLAD